MAFRLGTNEQFVITATKARLLLAASSEDRGKKKDHCEKVIERTVYFIFNFLLKAGEKDGVLFVLFF